MAIPPAKYRGSVLGVNTERPLRCVRKDYEQNYRHSEIAERRFRLLVFVVYVPVVVCHERILSQNLVCVQLRIAKFWR
jgi:hypothetical protein